MKPWTIYGITKNLTENFQKTVKASRTVSSIFKKSVHIFPIDVSNDNELNFEMSALAAPQYNIHRFGIFFTDSPRHADILLILGKVSEKMVKPLLETVNQMPEPYGVIIIEDKNDVGVSAKNLNIKNIVGYFDRKLEAGEILSVILNTIGREK